MKLCYWQQAKGKDHVVYITLAAGYTAQALGFGHFVLISAHNSVYFSGQDVFFRAFSTQPLAIVFASAPCL